MDNILESVKKLLGIDESCTAFDADIIMNINAAIFTLRQLGIGPKTGFVLTTGEEVYEDYLGDVDDYIVSEVKMYLYYKTRLCFDPPSSSAVLECLKEMIKEAEWRLNVDVETEEDSDEQS